MENLACLERREIRRQPAPSERGPIRALATMCFRRRCCRILGVSVSSFVRWQAKGIPPPTDLTEKSGFGKTGIVVPCVHEDMQLQCLILAPAHWGCAGKASYCGGAASLCACGLSSTKDGGRVSERCVQFDVGTYR
ncbi:hypothetical protein SBA5_720024 [Candidatus Sulfotelmatomonas gaucii]|uniref:Uncharacterized protein n=1 Tax=Candidatus Sulfuritelmatomonas gaucii TaxID=2043161 RepID=A0A2N9M2Z9_9BACT|nr:hypothetical protein SBA5_720024 [Candidatus Sulfotelmatomonas gaucii]